MKHFLMRCKTFLNREREELREKMKKVVRTELGMAKAW